MKAQLYLFFFILFTIQIFAVTADTLWKETWEGNWTNDWYVDNGTWEVGTPTSGPNNAYLGNKCVATVLNGNYSEPVSSRFIKITSINIPKSSIEPRLRFWHWFSLSDSDTGFVQIKVAGSGWFTLEKYFGTGGGTWSYTSLDLSSYKGNNIQLSFYFKSIPSGPWGSTDVGWYIDDISLISGQKQFYNPENFENGLGDWYATNSTWEVGKPTSGPNTAHAGINCLATKLDGNYYEPLMTRFISPEFKVGSTSDNPNIRFWHWYSISDADTGYVQLKTKYGKWKTISNKFTGTSSGIWSNYFIDLSSYCDSLVQISFYFNSVSSGPWGSTDVGWYIDDIAFNGCNQSVIPVELTDFTSTTKLNKVYLNWHTATEINNRGFEIERGIDNSTFDKIGFVEGNGTTTEIHEYSYNDMPSNSGRYYYRLKQIDFDGKFTYSKVIEVEYGMPDKFNLMQNYPNPFNPSTLIIYTLAKSGIVQLKVHDVLGREVAILVNEYKTAGRHVVEFDASNLSSGIYFYKLQASDFAQTKKMILLR